MKKTKDKTESGPTFYQTPNGKFLPSVYASALGRYYPYGGTFDMPRQQMYMPLDHVNAGGGYLAPILPMHFDKGTQIYRDTTALPFAEGGPLWGPYKDKKQEEAFQLFYSTLPENLQSDDSTYDIRGYWDSEGRPTEFNYNQPKESDGYYHAYSINSNTGEYLKSPAHSTFQHAVDEDRKIGWRPITNVIGRNIATENLSIADPEEQSFLRNTQGPVNLAHGGKLMDFPAPSLSERETNINYNVYASMPGRYYNNGGMIKRADGSYSQRGLWDNIRANKGSGKEPTKEMLAQERKIKSNQYGLGGHKAVFFPTNVSEPGAADKDLTYPKDAYVYANGGNLYDEGGPVYTYAGRPNARYRKEGNSWAISVDGGNSFAAIKDPTGKRTTLLNKQAKPIITTNYDPLAFNQISDNTRTVIPNQAVSAMNTHVYMESPEYKARQKAEKEAQIKFEQEQWNKYKNASTLEKVGDRVSAFAADPLGMTARAITGEQAYFPGMGNGLVDTYNPDRERYLKAIGYTPGAFEVSDLQNMVNPGYWANSIGTKFATGHPIEGAAEIGLMSLGLEMPGTQTAKKIASGLNAAPEFLTTQTPLKNAYKINPLANKEVPLNTLYHGSENPNLQFNDIIFTDVNPNVGSRPGQFKKRAISTGNPLELPGGFYTNDRSMPGFMGNNSYRYSMDIPANANVFEWKSGISDNISVKKLQELKNNGYDIIKGKNILGETEYIPLNKDIISNWKKFEKGAPELEAAQNVRFEAQTPHWLKGYPVNTNISTSVPKKYSFETVAIPKGAEGKMHNDAVDIINREFNNALTEAGEMGIPQGSFGHPERPSTLVLDDIGYDYKLPEGVDHTKLNQIAVRASSNKLSPEDADIITKSLIAHNPNLKDIAKNVDNEFILHGVASNLDPKDIEEGYKVFKKGKEMNYDEEAYNIINTLQNNVENTLPKNRGLGDFVYSPETLEKIKKLKINQ